jgi:hypothetical protein
MRFVRIRGGKAERLTLDFGYFRELSSLGVERGSSGRKGRAPKGLYDSARGFNPGNRPQPHRALKGRPHDQPKTYKKNVTVMRSSASTDERTSSRETGETDSVSPRLSGRIDWGKWFLGLKPQAESWCPFGAQVRRDASLTSMSRRLFLGRAEILNTHGQNQSDACRQDQTNKTVKVREQ